MTAFPASSPSVLVVDEERAVVEQLCRHLKREGCAARGALDIAQATALTARIRPDLLILAVSRSGPEGFDVLRRLRREHRRELGIILLGAGAAETERVAGLRQGADDYVQKPFSTAELLARAHAVLRRSRAVVKPPEGPVDAGRLRIEPASRRVFVAGVEVSLTRREFDLLLFLAQHPGQAFTRGQLLETIWGEGWYASDSTVTVHVRRLRGKLGSASDGPPLVQTVRGTGYRFTPPTGRVPRAA